MSKKLPKTITLAFLKRHFQSDHPVFIFWRRHFSINNTPLLEDFVKSCWDNMEFYNASTTVEKIIKYYLNNKMIKLYSVLCDKIGETENKDKEWEQIDLAFIDFLKGK